MTPEEYALQESDAENSQRDLGQIFADPVAYSWRRASGTVNTQQRVEGLGVEHG